MKQYNKSFLLLFSLCVSTAIFAVQKNETDNSAQLESAIRKISLQTTALQKEVVRLKNELHRVKQEKAIYSVPNQKKQVTPVKMVNLADKEHITSINGIPVIPTPTQSALGLLTVPTLFAAPIVNAALPDAYLALDPSAFISYQSSMSQGMFYLEQQRALENLLHGQDLANHSPKVILSGKLEGQAGWESPFSGSNNTSIDLVTAELDVLAQVSPWASGFMAVTYNNASLNQVLNGSGNPVNNSNIFLNRGFITIGNLNKTPFFFSTGQMYAPFGTYSSNMLTNPMTKVLGRTNTRALQVGYDKDNFNTSIYAFDGAASDTSSNTINNWGANANYHFSFANDYSVGLGVGFLNDLSDSQGLQITGGAPNTFQGFSQNASTEMLVRYVPAVDVNASLSRGPFYIVAEAIGATRSYNPSDLTFNGGGALPKASHLEAGYNFKMFDRRSIFSLAYEESWESLAIGLPKNTYVATLNTSIWKNTVLVLEYRHDVNYAGTDVAGGTCTNSGGNFTFCAGPVPGGGQQNTVLAQIGVYF